MTPTSLAACLLLFVAVGGLFLLAALGLGWLLRARVPGAAKLEAYECGEPPVGSTAVRFDLRFYVVALVFIVFEVEMALFFPPATVFGKATRLMDGGTPPAIQAELRKELAMDSAEGLAAGLARRADGKAEAERPPGGYPAEGGGQAGPVGGPAPADARGLALAAMADLAAFFAVILLGFAYVWRRGDLEWVRAVSES